MPSLTSGLPSHHETRIWIVSRWKRDRDGRTAMRSTMMRQARASGAVDAARVIAELSGTDDGEAIDCDGAAWSRTRAAR